MPRIQPGHIAAARRIVEPLSIAKAEQFADSVFVSQPFLLASVVVLPRLGVRDEDLDVVLRILFICHEAVLASGATIPTISESDQERCMARVVGRAKLIEGLEGELAEQAVARQFETYPEPYLLALASGILQEHHLARVRTDAEKYLLLAVYNIVETIAEALDRS